MGFLNRIVQLFFYPVGYLIVRIPSLNGPKTRILSTWHDQKRRTTLENLLFPSVFLAWINTEYLSEKDPDKRERLKDLAMGGESGANWAKGYDTPLNFQENIGDLPFAKAAPQFGLTEEFLKNNRNIVFIQVGSSSGREIAYFSRKFTENTYIGTDIYPGIIDYSSKAHQHENLRFVLSPAKDIGSILQQYSSQKILVFSSGSLQYVQPEHLMYFFQTLSRYDAEIILLETGSDLNGDPGSLRGSVWRDNFSYTHDYAFYAESAGLITVKKEIIRPFLSGKWSKVLQHTVHYCYQGRSPSASVFKT